MLTDEEKKRGVISASLGNHAQGLSYHAQKLDIPCTVVMPKAAPIMKIQKCRNYGANVVVYVSSCHSREVNRNQNPIISDIIVTQGTDMVEAKRLAMILSKEKKLVYVNGYDHPHIIAGQGTIGLEICEQVADADAVVVPVGGGGLIAGIAVAVKALNPRTKIIVSQLKTNSALAG